MGFGCGLKKIFGKDKNEEMGNSKNFKYLDDLIHSGVKEIVMDSDIILGNEKSEYSDGIELDVNDVVIDGNGHYIDARGKTRIFNCTGKNIALKNIRLTNGFAGIGGAILLEDGELTITGSIFDKNKSKVFGGAIKGKNCELTIIESTFNENFSKGHGGAIDFVFGELTIIESAFNENFAKEEGGAIWNRGNLSIKNSVFSKNSSKDHGGAICNMWAEVDITESTFIGNTSFRAGAIFSKGSNYEKAMNIVGSTFNENMANEKGGAIFSSEGIFTIKDSILNNNIAKKNGGAIGHLDDDLIITASTLNNNKAKKKGGAIWCINKKQLKLTDCIFEDNEPDDIYEDKK